MYRGKWNEGEDGWSVTFVQLRQNETGRGARKVSEVCAALYK